MLLTAGQIKAACGEMPFIFRAGVWKPRTSPHTFQGVGEEGLEWLKEVKERFGIAIATEVATPEHVQKALAAGIDYLWIGARSSANPMVVEAIAKAIADRDAVRPRCCKTANAVGPSQSDCKTANAVRPGTEPSDCKTANAVGPLALKAEIATCIYTGLMTDTGNFSYNSTNAELYDIIASLLRAGVKKDEIYNAVFNQFSSDRMRLAGYALYRKMRIYPEYHLALITLSADELDQYHYQTGDCEGIVNMPLQIADVHYSVMMREERAKPGTPKSRIRISLRSQGDRPVNIWAQEVFHGGGHMNASGGELLGSIPFATKIFEDSYKKYVKGER